MNDRIKELAEFHNINIDVMQAIYDDVMQLVVEESAELFNLTFTDEPYQRRIDMTLKKHFGVE